MEQYHFVTKWYFRAPIECVWAELFEGEPWQDWWKGWKKVTLHDPMRPAKVGSVSDNEARGFLPYPLRFTTEVTAIQAPKRLELKSWGDLVGTGRFELEARDGGTYVTFTWDVGTSNGVLNLLAKLPFARLLMELNHDVVMEDGFKAMKQRVEGMAGRMIQPIYHW